MDEAKDEIMSTNNAKGLTSNGNQRRNKTILRRIECTLCGKEISDRGNLNRHLRSIHDIQPKVRKPRVKCSFSNNCTFVCGTSTVLRNHLETVHGFSIVKNVLRFESRADFEKWKEEEEIKTCASYVTDTGVKNRNKKKVYYLRCHRSGFIRAEQNEKKMRLRSKPVKGYTQCGLTCPSSMQIVESQNGVIDVSYFPKHLGHRIDDESVRYIKLRKKEKEEIAAKLVQGESVSQILSEARVKKGGKMLSRVNFLQRRDVYNIKSKVTFLEKEIDQDGKYVDSWVRQTDFGMENNPVALYKPMDKNNDYILIIIHNVQKIMFSLLFDGSIIYVKTKKGKAKVDFNLTGVYGVNENGSGYPLAFCVSSKTDYATISTFFKTLYEAYGAITTQIFISDNINYYYIAWRNVMGESENRLICNFNVESLWERKLLELHVSLKKQESISKNLKSLLCETDPDHFDLELVKMLNTWNEDSELKRFVQYFYKYYCKKPNEWAHCYRIHSVRKENINNYLQPLYNQIERIYVEGSKNLLSALNSILILIRNECYINITKWDEDILEEKLREIAENHASTKDVADVSFTGSEWIVHHSDQYYNVRRMETNCGKDCGLICRVCDICIHSFACSCSDYLSNFTICFHIHAITTCNLSKECEKKYLAKSALKFSAVTLSKTITEYLEQSDLTDVQYDKIILDLGKLIKDHALKERFEDSCFKKMLWEEA
ncbi:UNVERIFIED_CONTAM: hypothetical protein PYX00_002685 [Menopon gallinae]|uniref:C2H2-type domain-containing protein n=1 Tax=Menopon gallinae TaxID=328185 RepID=A0AAW2HX17_9NEOP